MRLETRPVGEVLISQGHGRIVAGNEVFTLHFYVGDAIAKYGDVVLQLDQVEFVEQAGGPDNFGCPTHSRFLRMSGISRD